jgi:carbamoyl-phosphate synthase small subunit
MGIIKYPMLSKDKALLVLEDGSVFFGYSMGAKGETGGEIVFNTSMTGYQEILTDPSYKGQIVVMTYTQIGNYGVNNIDIESNKVQVNGFVIKELSPIVSNWRAIKDLDSYLKEYNVVGIWGIDTRALVKKIRTRGVIRGVISTEDLNPLSLWKKARQIPDISKQDLVPQVATKEIYYWNEGDWDLYKNQYRKKINDRPLVAVIDFGVKFNILRKFVEYGCAVAVLPPNLPIEEIEKLKPDGIFLSNGPGDPQKVIQGIKIAKYFFGKLPVMGICLGHQIIGLALGAQTFKLKFGHHGGNHPVKNLITGKVEITAQNHNFAINPETLPKEMEITHINLLDLTLEGMKHRHLPIMSVQYHPEASPGPHDSFYIFEEFKKLMEGKY